MILFHRDFAEVIESALTNCRVEIVPSILSNADWTEYAIITCLGERIGRFIEGYFPHPVLWLHGWEIAPRHRSVETEHLYRVLSELEGAPKEWDAYDSLPSPVVPPSFHARGWGFGVRIVISVPDEDARTIATLQRIKAEVVGGASLLIGDAWSVDEGGENVTHFDLCAIESAQEPRP